MRVTKRLIAATLLVALLYAGWRHLRRNIWVPYSYCVEARFESMPADDKPLAEWLKAQPGVFSWVGIGRFGADGKLLVVSFSQSRNLALEPPFPRLEEGAAALGHTGADGPFRDAADRSRGGPAY